MTRRVARAGRPAARARRWRRTSSPVRSAATAAGRPGSRPPSAASSASRLAPELLAGLDLSILPQLDPATRALTQFALLTPAVRMVRADRVRAHLRRQTARAFERADILAWPASLAPPPLVDSPVVELP